MPATGKQDSRLPLSNPPPLCPATGKPLASLSLTEADWASRQPRSDTPTWFYVDLEPFKKNNVAKSLLFFVCHESLLTWQRYRLI